MNFFRRLLLSLAVIIMLVGLAGMFLPTTAHVERSIVIDTSPENIWPHISDFKAWESWSPWYAKDPSAKFTYSGEPGTVGHRAAWNSENPKVGSGSQEIVQIKDNASMTTALDFGDQGEAQANLTLSPEGSGTRVTWSLDSDFSDNFAGRYVGLLLDKMVGADYEAGLANLKTHAGG